MLKRVMSSVLYLSVVWVLSACQFQSESPQFLSPRKPYATLATSIEKENFKFDNDLQVFIGTDGKSLRRFLLEIRENEKGYLRFVAYTKRAAAEAKRLLIALEISWNGSMKPETPLLSFGRYPPVELKIEILRYGLAVKSCHAENNKISFGCAVDINRALSLSDPLELTKGRTLSSSTGQRDIDVMQRYSSGKPTPFSDRGD